MKKRHLLPLLIIALSSFLLPAWVGATTLLDWINLGTGGFTIGDKRFYNFSYSSSASGGASEIDAIGVTVGTISNLLNPGLTFQAAWTVGIGQTLDSSINYDVVVNSRTLFIKDISGALLESGAIGTGVASVVETVTPGNYQISLFDLPGTNNDVLSQETLLDPITQGPIHIAKDISVVGGQEGAATISKISQQFSQTNTIPEPATMLLLGSGLLGMGVYARRRLKR